MGEASGAPPVRHGRLLPLSRALLPLAAAILLAGTTPAPAEEPEPAEADEPFQRAPDPATATGPDAELFRKGLELQREGKYRSARKVFFKLADEHPDSPFCDEAEDRSGDRDGNAFLGYTPMHPLGPTDRRIDVALMGDGYPLDKQDRFDKAAVGHIDVLMYEEVYAAYRTYFNFYRYNLASKDDGVDEVLRAPPDEELESRRKTRRKKKRAPKEFSTALDCKAAGPAGQVWANPTRVWHYLGYLEANDGLAICFAQKGQLGMGGMGIATTGPKGVVVHEFGHAFAGLLDEYQNNPDPPSGRVHAPNATTEKDDPPWKHFLDAKIPGVGVFEGGATHVKGVWRPASSSCAMNVGGGQYCPVCREATVLMIYSYVSPLEEAVPAISTVRPDATGWPVFAVTPKQPTTHDVEVTWFLDAAPTVTPSAGANGATDDPESDDLSPLERRLRERLKRREQPGSDAANDDGAPAPFPFRPGAQRRRVGTGNDAPPPGKGIRAKRAKTDAGWRSEPTLPALGPGRYVLTAVVRDPAKPKGARHPWVLKDDRGLLEDRVRWTLEVPDEPPAPEKR
jgi:hypothetical protein